MCTLFKRIPLKQTILYLILGSLLFSACRKEHVYSIPEESCLLQTTDPSGHSYAVSEIVPVQYTKKNCGLMPLNRNSYWVYQDSQFNNGVFVRVQYDTLRLLSFKTLYDQLIWWETSINVGLPELMYANDSGIFTASYRAISPAPVRDAKKEYGLFEGDSIFYLTNFEDVAAMGKAVKINETYNTPAGSFNDCILFEKKAPFSRRDQVIFKPGVGVLRYTSEIAMGSPEFKMQQVSTLVSFHLD